MISPQRCGHLGCRNPAIYRGFTTQPRTQIFRCQAHGGHHDFTGRWNGRDWEKFSPIHSTDPHFDLRTSRSIRRAS